MPPKSYAGPLQPGVMRRAYTDCRFGQLHYVRAAPPAPAGFPTLVLLHQNPSSWLEYVYLVEALATDREVVVFDTPGNGMSDGPAGPMSMQDYAAAFADGLDALRLGRDRPVDVFGFHTGTFLAAELALHRPERVGRLVLSGVPHRSEAERQAQLAKLRATPTPTEDGGALFERLRWMWDFLVAQRDRRVPIERAADLFIERARPLHRFWWPYEGVWTYPVAERFPLIDKPTLFLQPHEALLEPTREAMRLTPNAQMVELPELSRDVFEKDVGVPIFTREMRRFLV